MIISWRKNIAISPSKASFVAILFFLLSFFIFGLAFLLVDSYTKNLSRDRFLKETDELKADIQFRIDTATAVLYHVKGFFESSVLVEPDEWKKYVGVVEVLKRSPDLTALTYIERVSKENREVFLSDIRKTFPDYKIFPETNKDEHFLVKYVETHSQSDILGFDAMSDSDRSKVIMKARDTGVAASTDAISVPAAIKTDIKGPVFSIYVPIYYGESRFFQGVISAAFALQNFFPNIFGKNLSQDLEIKVSNGKTIYYHEDYIKRDKVLTDFGKINVADKEWNVNFSAAEGFGLARTTQMLPILILLFGLLFSIVFAFVIYYSLVSRERAVILAKNITAQIEAVLSSIGEGLFATDKNGNIMLVNLEFENMLGLKAAEVYGKNFFQVLPMLDEDKMPVPENSRSISKILKDEAKFATTATAYYQRRDKTFFPVAIHASSITIGSNLTGAVEVFRDITKEKEIDQAKTDFISIAVHQLRTPISGLNWLTESLRYNQQNLNEKQKRYINNLSTYSKRLIELVEDLLDFSRIKLKTKTAEKNQIDPLIFIEDFVKEMEPYAVSKNHEIIFNNKTTGQFKVEINSRAFYSVLQNYISNAIDYSPNSSLVTVNLEKTDGSVKVSVSNKGPAIPKDEQSHIFERFYRGESAKKIKPEGTGLGLYVIKEVTEEAGGRVGFESGEGKDTTFWFTIPFISKNKNNL